MASIRDALAPMREAETLLRKSARLAKQREYQRGYIAAHETRAHHYAGESAHRRDNNFWRPFCSWDGEGEQDEYGPSRYIVFANSDGATLSNREGLSTTECLDLIWHADKSKIHVAYGFNYDVHMMLHELPLRGSKHSMEDLYKNGSTFWGKYRIENMPKKWMRVSRDLANGKTRTVTIYDTLGFFQRALLLALDAWKVPYSRDMRDGKAQRGNFQKWPLERIIAYNAEELSAHVLLMDKLRVAMDDSNLRVTRWHGSGAIAEAWLRREGIKNHMRPVHPDMEDAVLRAYVGGRIESAGIGYVPHVYNFDINSAYAWALTQCPSLTEIEWTWGDMQEGEAFSLVHVKWDCWADKTKDHDIFAIYYPFPYRDKQGRIIFPSRGEGWYWQPEVIAAQKRWGAKCIRVLEAWTPKEKPQIFPFREQIHRDFALRAQYKKEGNAAEYTIKVADNSLYGKLAQRLGYKGKTPAFQCYAWAGFITSSIRAKIYSVISERDDIVSIMTDGVWATNPIEGIDAGKNLGQWSLEHEGESCYALGAGVYGCYRYDAVVCHGYGRVGAWVETENKQRGFGRSFLPHRPIYQGWHEGKDKFKTQVTRFVGTGLALQSPKYAENYRRFTDFPRELANPYIHGNSKRRPATYESLSELGFSFCRVDGEVTYQEPHHNDSDECSYPYSRSDLDVGENIMAERLMNECEEGID